MNFENDIHWGPVNGPAAYWANFCLDRMEYCLVKLLLNGPDHQSPHIGLMCMNKLYGCFYFAKKSISKIIARKTKSLLNWSPGSRTAPPSSRPTSPRSSTGTLIRSSTTTHPWSSTWGTKAAGAETDVCDTFSVFSLWFVFENYQGKTTNRQ